MENLLLIFPVTVSMTFLYLLYKMQKKQNNIQNEIDETIINRVPENVRPVRSPSPPTTPARTETINMNHFYPRSGSSSRPRSSSSSFTNRPLESSSYLSDDSDYHRRRSDDFSFSSFDFSSSDNSSCESSSSSDCSSDSGGCCSD